MKIAAALMAMLAALSALAQDYSKAGSKGLQPANLPRPFQHDVDKAVPPIFMCGTEKFIKVVGVQPTTGATCTPSQYYDAGDIARTNADLIATRFDCWTAACHMTKYLIGYEYKCDPNSFAIAELTFGLLCTAGRGPASVGLPPHVTEPRRYRRTSGSWKDAQPGETFTSGEIADEGICPYSQAINVEYTETVSSCADVKDYSSAVQAALRDAQAIFDSVVCHPRTCEKKEFDKSVVFTDWKCQRKFPVGSEPDRIHVHAVVELDCR